MSHNGTEPVLNQKRGVEWLKGHLRPEVEASSCLHLSVGQSPRFQAQPASNIMGQDGKPQMRWVFQPAEGGLFLSCNSESLLGQLREQLRLPPDLDQQYTSTGVTLEICRMCPFFEREQ